MVLYTSRGNVDKLLGELFCWANNCFLCLWNTIMHVSAYCSNLLVP